MPHAMFDPTYEFDAPRFWDFNQQDDSGVDAFFDQKVSQPSPIKKIGSKRKTVGGNFDIAEKTNVKKPVPSSQARSRSIANDWKENKPRTETAPLNKPPLPIHALKSRIVAASPTVGLKKCKPKSPTKIKTFSSKMNQRVFAPRVNERNEISSAGSDSIDELKVVNGGDKGDAVNGTVTVQSGDSSTVHRSKSSDSVKTVPTSNTTAYYSARRSLYRSASQGKSIYDTDVSNGYRRTARTLVKTSTKSDVTKSMSSGDVAVPESMNVKPYQPRVEVRSVSTEQRKTLAHFNRPNVPSTVPLKRCQPRQEVKPFKLRTDERDEKYRQKWRAKLAKEEEERRKKSVFRAQPMPSFKKTVLSSNRGEKHFTQPHGFQLHTAKRAELRKVFDTALKEKEEQTRKDLDQKEMERLHKQELETKELRRTLVHHAQPIRLHKPFEIKRGAVASTVPEPPKFMTDQRLKEREMRPQNGWANKL